MSNRGEYTNIRIESLNLNGVNSEKLFLLENYVIENDPDVLLIQETKVNVDSLPPNMNLAGYNLDVKGRNSEQKSGGWFGNLLERTNCCKTMTSKISSEQRTV